MVGRIGGKDQKVEEDRGPFLRELEEDDQMRGVVHLYRVKDATVGAGSGTVGEKTRGRRRGVQ